MFGFKQDYTNTTGRITMKLGGRMWYGPGKNQLHCVDLDQGAENKAHKMISINQI